MNDNTLKSGSLLQGGKYKITGVLGQGGFGITYEAEQTSLNRRVAVEEFFMKEHCNRDETTSHVSVPSVGSKELVLRFKDKFIREARMIAGLNNEHIVKIYDVFEENGTAYYVMEYLGGGSLGDGVKAGKAMPEPEAVESIRQIASALSYLHRKGIIHFDIKPSNVLRDEDGRLKLIDFGISKHYDEAGHQTSSTPVGISKGYAPLEQYQQSSDIKSFTPATDIYSLGATLFALLTGGNPPEASIIYEDGLPIIDGVNPIVMRTIEKSMQPRRKDRPQSVAEFLALLDGTAREDDDEQTIVPASTAKEPNLEKAEASVQKSAQSQKSEEQKSKGFPKWLYGLIAGVLVAVLAAVLINRPDSPSATDNLQADSTAVVAEAVLEKPVTSKPTASVSKPEIPSKPEAPAVVELKSISLSKPTLELEEGQSATLTVKYNPSNATDKTTTWKSTDASVVKVSTSGKVTAVKAGAATIIVRCGDKESTCAVSVKRKVIEVESIVLDKKSLILEEGQSANLNAECSPSNATDRQVEWESSDMQIITVSNNGLVTAMSSGSATVIAKSGVKTAYCNIEVQSRRKRENGYEYVDLGLSVKWATCNVGASSPEDYGDYFAWGETSPKGNYDYSNLKYCLDGRGASFSKYNNTQAGIKDSRTRLELSDDAARANWGGSWRMPTEEELNELREQCNWERTTVNGHEGYRVTSKVNGRSIFLPAAGHRVGGNSYDAGSAGDYWSSSVGAGINFACYLNFYGSKVLCGDGDRRYGRSVRPVFR